MADEEAPKGGVHLDAGFGALGRRGAAREIGAPPPFDLVIVGDFGRSGPGRLTDISGEDIASLLAAHGAVARLEVGNRLGSQPPALAVALPLRALRDLDSASLPARVPELVRASEIAAAFARNPSLSGLDDEARGPRFEHLAAALLRDAPAPRPNAAASSPAAAPGDDGSLDSLLSMVDIPAPPPEEKRAQAAISAFVASTQSRAPAAPKAAPPPGLIAAQSADIAGHPDWLRLEAAWRGLGLIMAARGRGGVRPRLLLWDAGREDLAETLAGAEFAQALAGDGGRWGAVLALGAFEASPKDLATLRLIAQAGEALRTPVIVSLAEGFFGRPAQAVATLDDPAALLEGPAHDAWRGLRGAPESQYLFAAWNDLVLRAGEAGRAPLFGGAGIAVAAQIAASLSRSGWPTEILGNSAPLDGLDLAETVGAGGRSAAIPLRALVDPGVARDLARAGLICLTCRADRDQAWLVRAASAHDHGRVPDEHRAAMESFAGLPFRFVSTLLESLCRATVAGLPRGESDEAAAAAIARALSDALDGSGPGASVDVAIRPPEGEATRGFEISVRLGGAVMGGFDFSFDLDF